MENLNLTEQEKTFLKELNFIHTGRNWETGESFEAEYSETTDDGKEYCRNSALGARKARGVLSSLMQKGVLDYGGNEPENRDCWNPIFKGRNYEQVMKEVR